MGNTRKIKIEVAIAIAALVVFLSLTPLACTIKRKIANPENGTTEPPAPQIPAEVFKYTIHALGLRSYGTGKAPRFVKELGTIRGYKARVLAYESDGITQYVLEHRPAGAVPKDGWPLIIVAHGHVTPSQWTTEGNYISVSSRYAAGGFLILKPDYRGHGNSGGEAPGAYRAAAYAIDVLNLAHDALLLPYIDTSRIFLYGHSMGGSVALATLEASSIFKAASIWAGVTRPFPEDTLYYLSRRDKAQADLRREELKINPGEYFFPLFSPISNLDKIKVPLIIRHGTADLSVPFEWSTEFRAALDAADVRYEFVEYPGADHNISQSFNKALDADLMFFRASAP
mgnify:FL=1